MSIQFQTQFRIRPSFLLFFLVALFVSTAAVADEVVLLKAIIPVNEYVIAKSDGQAKANGDANDPRIQFTLEKIGGGKFHLRTIFDTYLTAEGGGGDGVHADATTPGDYETFSFTTSGDLTYIETFDGSFLCAKSVGGLNAKASSCDVWDVQNTAIFQVIRSPHPIQFSEIVSRTEVGDGEWDIVGDLVIPTPEGDVVLRNADITVDYGNSIAAGIESFSGTAEMPQLPSGSGCGLWCSGNFGYNPTTTASHIQVGYGRPSEMPNPFELPLDDDTGYFYLLLESGHGVDWNGHEISTPDSGAMQVVIDHQAPTVFFYTDFPYGLGDYFGPVQSVGFGVSRGSEIPFVPLHTTGVSQWLTPFDAELYVGGEVDLSLIEGLTLILESDVFAEVDNGGYLGNGSGFLADLGYNGILTYGVDLGVFALDFYLGSASLRYERKSSLNRVSVSGVVSPDDDFAGIPFRMKREATFYGYFDDDSSNSAPNFFYLEGEIDMGTPFAQQRIEGAVEISEDGGWFDGRARFGGTSMSVEGEFTKDWIRLEGDLSHSWNINAGKIKVTVDAEFDSRDNGVDLDARIQFCEDAVTNSCDSIGGSVRLDGDGDIKVCANVPGVGERCDTL